MGDQILEEDKKEELRKVLIDMKLAQNPNTGFVSNEISTTKYSLQNFALKYISRWSFLPKAFVIQFMRLSNVYFLLNAIIACTDYSPLHPFSSVAPLCFVIAVSMLREAIEDQVSCFLSLKRKRRNDNMTNAQKAEIWCRKESKFVQKRWDQVKVGDLVCVREDQFVPADLIILATSTRNGECFIQTATLDGERALKPKFILDQFKRHFKLHPDEGVVGCERAHLQFEKPNKNIYKLYADLQVEEGEAGSQSSLAGKMMISNAQVALRGCLLANTEWVIGLAIYTGQETKILLNLGQKRQKQSMMEQLINKVVIFLLITQTVLCTIMALYSGQFTAQNQGSNAKYQADYIFEDHQKGQAKDIDLSPTIEGVKTYVAYFLLLSTLIPISLIVTLEVVKFLQTITLEFDVGYFCEVTLKLLHVHNMTIHEDLAKVKYVFADKTGTLTSNVMVFKGCSVGSVCYDEDYHDEDYEYNYEDDKGLATSEADRESIVSSKMNEFKQKVINKARKGTFAPTFNRQGEMANVKQRYEPSKILWDFNPTVILKQLFLNKKSFNNDLKMFGGDLKTGGKIVLKRQNDYLHWFWVNVVVCHDVMVTASRKNPQEKLYQGQSPDEITLLDAAKEVGYIFTEKTQATITVEIAGHNYVFDLLHKIEFSSERQMMSVIVKDPTSGCIILFAKGADAKIMSEKYMCQQQHFFESTKQDLNKFAKKGFRTLCFGMKHLEKGYFQEWLNQVLDLQKRIAKAAGNIQKMKIFIEQLKLKYEQVETGLFLMGATALEDKLQEDVPRVIQDLCYAGIKVWMLTGDKLETAYNIGFSCKMFTENMNPFSLSSENCKNLKQIEEKMSAISEKIIVAKTQIKSKKIIGSSYVINQDDFLKTATSQLKLQKDNSIRSSDISLGSNARGPAIKRKAQKIINEMVPDKKQVVRNLLKKQQVFKPQDKSLGVKLPNLVKLETEEELKFGLIIEGSVLSVIMGEEKKELLDKLIDILGHCESVIVCRASPAQKAQIVQVIRKQDPKAVTLAIGDGANDVNMIQKANIGVGIFGNEGYQAASAADYAIGRFKHLERLLFVHGRQCGIRISIFVFMFFYKNLIFTLPHFWYGLFNAYSANTFWDEWYILGYNSWITALGIGCYAIWDWDIQMENCQNEDVIKHLMPFLYRAADDDESFTMKKFFFLVFMGIFHSILIFVFPMFAVHNSPDWKGMMMGLNNIQVISFITMVNCHYLMLFMFARKYSLFHVVAYALSFLLYCPLGLLMPDFSPISFVYKSLEESTRSNHHFVLVSIFVTAAIILPLQFYLSFQRLVYPSLKHLIVQGRINFEEIRRALDPSQREALKEMFIQMDLQRHMQEVKPKEARKGETPRQPPEEGPQEEEKMLEEEFHNLQQQSHYDSDLSSVQGELGEVEVQQENQSPVKSPTLQKSKYLMSQARLPTKSPNECKPTHDSISIESEQEQS